MKKILKYRGENIWEGDLDEIRKAKLSYMPSSPSLRAPYTPDRRNTKIALRGFFVQGKEAGSAHSQSYSMNLLTPPCVKKTARRLRVAAVGSIHSTSACAPS